ncbi:uncharacterized protein LOC134775823 [Penaeus indicus]|uniref:uncharacterized protein LOC134775823 n=1 Tax=Penaeus indicus TaxID=29960 RepID=UPI00300C9E32
MTMPSPSSVLLLLVGVSLQAALCHGCPAPYKSFANRWCLLVVVTAPKNGPGEPLLWNEARAKCGEARGDLAVIDKHEKLQLLSRFIDETYPGQPAPQNDVASLVPSDQVHGRRYVTSNTHQTQAPGYICERF